MWNSIVSWVSRELNSATLKQKPLQINWKASTGPLVHLQYGQIGIREANILSNHRNLHLHKAFSCISIQKKILKTLRTGIVGGGSSIIQTELVRLSKVSALFVHSCRSGCAILTLKLVKLHNQPHNRLIILHLISQLQHKWFSTKPQPCRSASDGEEMNSTYLWKFSCFRMATWAFWF